MKRKSEVHGFAELLALYHLCGVDRPDISSALVESYEKSHKERAMTVVLTKAEAVSVH